MNFTGSTPFTSLSGVAKENAVHDFRYLDNTAILRLTAEQCIGCGC